MKRLHVHVAVHDLESSIRFYKALFDAEPTVKKDDYAKWQLEDPRVNFAISKRGAKAGLDHLGIQVDHDAELGQLRSQLERHPGISRVEIRFVPQDVPVIVPVERIVERVVERIIYVPVPADGTATPASPVPTPTVLPGGTPTPAGADPSGLGPVSAAAGVAVPGGLTASGAIPVDPGANQGEAGPGRVSPPIRLVPDPAAPVTWFARRGSPRRCCSQ